MNKTTANTAVAELFYAAADVVMIWDRTDGYMFSDDAADLEFNGNKAWRKASK
jgi:hypothetical protein